MSYSLNKSIHFWNGNKSVVRQNHESELLDTILAITAEDHGKYTLVCDSTDYPSAEDEGNIFQNGADILVTVAGNQKFKGRDFIRVSQSIAKGILGKRLLIIPEELSDIFREIKERGIKTLRAGIPETWADADLFRHNGYRVVEKGHLEDIFERLKRGEFDYVSLGANEIEDIYQHMAKPLQGLVIESKIMLHYPMPLVFYVHPDKQALSERIKAGLERIIENGTFDAIFEKHYGDCMRSLSLDHRTVFEMSNPFLP